MKLVTIVGARPQFIKLAPVSFEISTRKNIEEIILHTGQHFDKNMSEIFFSQMSIPKPKYNLNIGGGTHAQNTGRMLEKIEKILLTEKPDAVLVYGDTDTTLSGALTAAKLYLPVIHIESGLRSFNRKMPEEINRLITDHISTICFAPSNSAVDNLLKEGINAKNIIRTDDVMVDAAKIFCDISDKNSNILKENNLEKYNFLLATIHRKENTEDKETLESILTALSIFSSREKKIVIPLHPRTKKYIEYYSLQNLLEGLICIEPVGYLDMIQLEKYASLVITDSGGVQKEAFFHNTFCLTLRNETEWVELVQNGWNKLVDPTDVLNILKEISEGLKMSTNFLETDIYGQGNAARQIADSIEDYFKI